MRYFVLFMIIMSFMLLFSAEFEITSKIQENPAHLGLQMLDDEYKYDNNGDLCALLIVRCGVEDINFSNTASKVAQIDKQGEYYITMKKGARYIVLKKDGFGSFKEIFGLVMRNGSVYEMSADEKFKEASEIPVVITCNHNGAEVFVDGVSQGIISDKTLVVKVEIGSHKIKVSKDGFAMQEITESITVENYSFNITLNEIEPVMITIKTTPTDADIYINNVKEGMTNKQIFKFPSEYTLRLSKDKYDHIEETILVTEAGNNVFEYILKKNTSILSISTTPSDCKISINNEELSGNSKEVSAGKYKVEVKKEGYFLESRTITVSKGIDKSESFSLEQKTGKMQFVVEPMEAEVSLKQGNQAIQSWSGSKYLSKLPAGNYTVSVTCNGYQSKTQPVKIDMDVTTEVNITLEEGSDIPEGMVFVEGGTFQMGSTSGDDDEKPEHSVTLSDFYIGKYEVTVAELKEFIDATDYITDAEKNGYSYIYNGSWSKQSGVTWKDDVKGNEKNIGDYTHPVIHVSWNDAAAYCKWAGGRLPTEAEWEYAARGGNKSKSYQYAGNNDIGSVAWYDVNSGDKTQSVGGKQANKLGIFDMSGNVWEWCWDWYGNYSSSSQTNPEGPDSGFYRVSRGGSWYNNASYCRVACRSNRSPGRDSFNLGFRLVRSSK